MLTISFICLSCINKMFQEVLAVLSDVNCFYSLCYQILSYQIIKPFVYGSFPMKSWKFILSLFEYFFCLSKDYPMCGAR